MSKKGQRLRALVKDRLTAAAEEIFALFERTIAEYEEELCYYKEENQRKQKTLDSVLSPSVLLPRVALQTPSPGPELKKETAWTLQMKEEPEVHFIKQEEQQPVAVQEFCGVSVKTQESSLPLEAEYRGEPGEEDISAESHLRSETEEDTEHSSDTDEEWGKPFSRSADSDTRSIIAQNSGLSPKYISAPEASAKCGTAEGLEEKKCQCFVCKQKLSSKYQLQVHLGVHTVNNPYTCPICKKALASKTSLIVHSKQHTREKPYICPMCKKAFVTKTSLMVHAKLHTEGKSFRCKICKKIFAQESILQLHMKMHSGK